MIAIFWQWKIWEPLQKLLAHFDIEAKAIDYKDRDEELFNNAEQIIVHQAVKPDAEIYQKYGSKAISELNFIWQFIAGQPWGNNLHFIGVTGTDGKSTTCYVLYELLKGLNTEYSIRLSWNFDESLATTINHIIDGGLTAQKHIIVTELSSFLLYGLKDLWLDYSVRTNISPDHLNRHPDMKDYVATKYRIFQHTTKAIFTTEGVMDELTKQWLELTHTAPVTIYHNDYPLTYTQFVGAHNAGNLQVCYLLVKTLIRDYAINIDEEKIHEVIQQIKPLAHRIQLINEKMGIRFYDDSKSTSSQSLKVALEAFPGPIVLIAWGSDKGDNFSALAELMKLKVGYWVFIGTTGPQFVQIAEGAWIEHSKAASMEEAVKMAYEYARNHEIQVILLSPGCASFDMFKDYLDRAHQFANAVKTLS